MLRLWLAWVMTWVLLKFAKDILNFLEEHLGTFLEGRNFTNALLWEF